MTAEPISRTYRVAMGLCAPVLERWSQLSVSGLEELPVLGPTLLVGNHDSYWDPIAVGVAAIRRRQIRALAKSSLWRVKGLDAVLDGMGQIPIARGSSDAAAFARAIAELEAGACIGVFPEGTISLGRTLRARSGVGRLAAAVPAAAVICCSIQGTAQIRHFPERPRVRIRFFRPEKGGLQTNEEPGAFAARLLQEIRMQAPVPPRRRWRPVPAQHEVLDPS